jgi:putative phosphoesterase
MKIGLLSDTHGYLDPKIENYVGSCDEIWHAGDIGDVAVVLALQKLKPLKAVFGNIDDKEIRAMFPEDWWFTCEGLTIWMTHIGGAPSHYFPRIKKILQQRTPDVFICGHSHILKVEKDKHYHNMLYLNPGAAGNQGFHPVKTMLRFEVNNRIISHLEVIELGKRGQLS